MPEGLNRVHVDLPLRLQKAKAAAFQLERERDEAYAKLIAVQTAIELRGNIDDKHIVDAIVGILDV